MSTLLLADINTLIHRLGLTNVKANVDKYIIERGPDMLGNFIAAVAIFYLGGWGAKFGERILYQVLHNAKVDETLTKFLCRITYALALCAVVLASLEQLNVNTTSVTAVLAAAGLAVGMALQGSLSNFAAGVMIILFRPFKVSDFIEAAGTKGIVEEINVFSTLLRTPDNIEIVVPNSSITGGNITNYSSKPTRRIDMIVSCGYSDDLLQVKRFLEQLLRDDPRVLHEPAPVVAVSELAESSVNFVVRPWVKNSEYWLVRWDLTEKIKLGFDHHGFEIPFPQRDLHVHTDDNSVSSIGPAAGVSQPELMRPQEGFAAGLLRPRRAA